MSLKIPRINPLLVIIFQLSKPTLLCHLNPWMRSWKTLAFCRTYKIKPLHPNIARRLRIQLTKPKSRTATLRTPSLTTSTQIIQFCALRAQTTNATTTTPKRRPPRLCCLQNIQSFHRLPWLSQRISHSPIDRESNTVNIPVI